MKIKINFHIATMFFGGIEKVLLSYLTNLDRDYFEVSLTIARNMGDKLEVLLDEIPKDIQVNYLIKSPIINNIPIKKKLGLRYSFIEKLSYNLLLRKLGLILHYIRFYFKSKNYDVIVDFDLCSYSLKSSASLISVLHFSLASQLKTAKDIKRVTHRFEQSSAIIVLNQEMKTECIKYYPHLADKFHIVYNPFDIDKIRLRSNDYIQSLPSQDYVVTVCRLEESQKDVTSLIKAFAILSKDLAYGGNLVIVGDGSSYQELKDLTIDLGITEKVIFTGAVANPFVLMKHAKVFVLSSKFEGLPGVVIEAMICGIPVVATKCPTGVVEILQNGKCGILVEIGDVKQMAFSIHQLLEDKNLVNNFLSNAETRVADFSIGNNLNKFAEVVKKTLV